MYVTQLVYCRIVCHQLCGGFNTAVSHSNFLKVSILYTSIAVPLFTARCYAECGYATVSRLSVCPPIRV